MLLHSDISDRALHHLIRHRQISLGGNRQLKIYGLLHCCSGKKMHRTRRVFFKDEAEAIAQGYRPCGHCLREKYMAWKKGIT